jgi:hypothetical protein
MKLCSLVVVDPELGTTVRGYMLPDGFEVPADWTETPFSALMPSDEMNLEALPAMLAAFEREAGALERGFALDPEAEGML